MWSYSTNLYYLSPSDLTGGVYNLTLKAQYKSGIGTVGSGNARMFPKQRPYNYYNYFHRYNFDAAWSGKVYSVAVQPVIYSVTPTAGSIAGGTVVKVSE